MSGQLSRPGWTAMKFGDFVDNVRESGSPTPEDSSGYIGLEDLDSGSLHIRRWGAAVDLKGDKLHMKKGDLLFAKRNAYLRRVAIAPHDGYFSAHGMVLRPKPARVWPDFLPFFLQSDAFMNRAIEISVGSLSPTINWGTLRKQEFALPPVEEQKRIAELLWATDEAADEFRHTDQACQGLLLSLSSHFFPCARGAGASDYKQLGEVCALQAGHPFGSHEYTKTGDRLLRGSNVGVNATVWTDENTCFWPLDRRHEVSEYVLHEGDIVVAMDRPFIGEGFKIARMSNHDLPCLLLQRVGRFIPTHQLDNDYLWAYLRSRSFRQHLLSAQHGTELPHISTFDIESAILPVPSLREQHRIAGFFQVVEQSRAALATHSSSVSRLLKSLEDGMTAGGEDTRV